jgi:hypothetical protein
MERRKKGIIGARHPRGIPGRTVRSARSTAELVLRVRTSCEPRAIVQELKCHFIKRKTRTGRGRPGTVESRRARLRPEYPSGGSEAAGSPGAAAARAPASRTRRQGATSPGRPTVMARVAALARV